MSSSDNFVSVPVPVNRLDEVYALLGRQPRPDAGARSPDGSTNGAVWQPEGDSDDDDVHPWTEATLRRMYNDSTGNMRDALDYMAARGGQEVTTNELATALDLPKGAASVAGMIGAFARRCWNRYERYLPWESWWQPIAADEGRTETVFVMPAEVASVLRGLAR